MLSASSRAPESSTSLMRLSSGFSAGSGATGTLNLGVGIVGGHPVVMPGGGLHDAGGLDRRRREDRGDYNDRRRWVDREERRDLSQDSWRGRQREGDGGDARRLSLRPPLTVVPPPVDAEEDEPEEGELVIETLAQPNQSASISKKTSPRSSRWGDVVDIAANNVPGASTSFVSTGKDAVALNPAAAALDALFLSASTSGRASVERRIQGGSARNRSTRDESAFRRGEGRRGWGVEEKKENEQEEEGELVRDSSNSRKRSSSPVDTETISGTAATESAGKAYVSDRSGDGREQRSRSWDRQRASLRERTGRYDETVGRSGSSPGARRHPGRSPEAEGHRPGTKSSGAENGADDRTKSDAPQAVDENEKTSQRARSSSREKAGLREAMISSQVESSPSKSGGDGVSTRRRGGSTQGSSTVDAANERPPSPCKGSSRPKKQPTQSRAGGEAQNGVHGKLEHESHEKSETQSEMGHESVPVRPPSDDEAEAPPTTQTPETRQEAAREEGRSCSGELLERDSHLSSSSRHSGSEPSTSQSSPSQKHAHTEPEKSHGRRSEESTRGREESGARAEGGTEGSAPSRGASETSAAAKRDGFASPSVLPADRKDNAGNNDHNGTDNSRDTAREPDEQQTTDGKVSSGGGSESRRPVNDDPQRHPTVLEQRTSNGDGSKGGDRLGPTANMIAGAGAGDCSGSNSSVSGNGVGDNPRRRSTGGDVNSFLRKSGRRRPDEHASGNPSPLTSSTSPGSAAATNTRSRPQPADTTPAPAAGGGARTIITAQTAVPTRTQQGSVFSRLGPRPEHTGRGENASGDGSSASGSINSGRGNPSGSVGGQGGGGAVTEGSIIDGGVREGGATKKRERGGKEEKAVRPGGLMRLAFKDTLKQTPRKSPGGKGGWETGGSSGGGDNNS